MREKEQSGKLVGLLCDGHAEVGGVFVVGVGLGLDFAPEVGSEEGVRFCDLMIDDSMSM